jgi:thioredoxin 1
MQSSTNSRIVHVTTESFDEEVIGAELPVVIDFWAPWCGPCRALGPILEDLSEKWEGKVKVAKINIDEEPALASGFQIASIPTMIAMKGKEVLDVQVGLGGPAAVERLFFSATETEVQDVA